MYAMKNFGIFPDQENKDQKEEKEMTLEEYSKSRKGSIGSGLVTPAIPEDKDFILQEQFLQLLRETPFYGNEEESAHKHVEAVEEISDLFHTHGVTKDAVMLRVFPITLQGRAKKWLKDEPPGTIRTWNQLKDKFINQFSPPSKITKLKIKIQGFQQEYKETLYEAWTRFKDLLRDCPQHDFNPHQIITIFYSGISVGTRQMLDSQGPIPKKKPSDSYELIEEMANHSHLWHSTEEGSVNKESKTIGELSAIVARLSSQDQDKEEAMKRKTEELGEKVSKLEEILEEFVKTSETRHSRAEEAANRISLSTSRVLKEHQEFVERMERQVKEFSEALKRPTEFGGNEAKVVVTRTGPKSNPEKSKLDNKEEKEKVNQEEGERKDEPEKEIDRASDTVIPGKDKVYKPEIPYPGRLKKEKRRLGVQEILGTFARIAYQHSIYGSPCANAQIQ